MPRIGTDDRRVSERELACALDESNRVTTIATEECAKLLEMSLQERPELSLACSSLLLNNRSKG